MIYFYKMGKISYQHLDQTNKEQFLTAIWIYANQDPQEERMSQVQKIWEYNIENPLKA